MRQKMLFEKRIVKKTNQDKNDDYDCPRDPPPAVLFYKFLITRPRRITSFLGPCADN